MEESNFCEVVETDTSEAPSEVSSIISGRQAQLYVKTKEGKIYWLLENIEVDDPLTKKATSLI